MRVLVKQFINLGSNNFNLGLLNRKNQLGKNSNELKEKDYKLYATKLLPLILKPKTMKVSNPNKNRIVKGVIGIIFLILTSLVAMYFNNQKTKDKNNNFETVENYDLNSNDSSSQVLLSTKQNNSNIGNITNEYVMGDKVVNNNDIPRTKSNQIVKTKIQDKQPSTQIDKIENNGNLSISQTGGVVNQTTIINPKPSARHLTEIDAKIILRKIPLYYTVDVNYPAVNKECESFANEIIKLLDYYSYKKITRSNYGQIVPDLEESYYIKLDDENKMAQIIVYRQK